MAEQILRVRFDKGVSLLGLQYHVPFSLSKRACGVFFVHVAKGQLILKVLFVSSNSSKERRSEQY